MRVELREVAARVLDHDFGSMPTIPPDILEMLMPLAYWVATIRGTVTRDKYSREITRRAYIERPTRLSVQLTKLLLGIAMFKHKNVVDLEDYRIIKNIGISTAPSHLEQLLRAMAEEDIDGTYTVQDCADIMRLPLETSRRFAEDLTQLGILRVKRISSIVQQWRISSQFKIIIKEAHLFTKI